MHDCEAIEKRPAALEKRIEESERRGARYEADAESWRQKFFGAERQIQRLTGELIAKDKTIAELKAVIAKQQSEIKWLQKQVFGRKAEPTKCSVSPVECATPAVRERGKQPGAKGYGRKIRDSLPVEVVVHEPSQPTACSKCKAPYASIGEGETSEEISWEWHLVRKQHRRPRYVRTCSCHGTPKFVLAEPPRKLIPKGLFDVSFWENVLIEKFLLQRPMNKVREQLDSLGLSVSLGTLTQGLRRLSPLFAPLYEEILDHWKSASQWQMDETHWKVFEDVQEKQNHTWWMWVAVSKDTCAFVLDPTRSAQVPKKLLDGVEYGFLTTDRYSAYQSLPKSICNTYCWSHLRRDFINLRDGYPDLAPIAQTWIEKISDIFQDNELRLKEGDIAADARLRENIAWMQAQRDWLLKSRKTHLALKKVLKSLSRFWDGLIVFVDCPMIPMDNNECERRLRDLVVGRKNYYGSGSIWSGELAVMLFSLFQTLDKNGVEPRAFLRHYLELCRANGGKPPPNSRMLLPWNAAAELVDVVH